MPRSSRADAAHTRCRILERAADLGSVEGLESVSIGRLAGELELSKGGVIGPFGSKEELQLAAVEAAGIRFRREVWDPAADRPPGLARLSALVDAWLSYLERGVFPGGCFFTAAALEFDDRPGPVRDAIAAGWELWLRVLEAEVASAQRQGEASSEIPPGEVAFELHAHVVAGNLRKQLYRDEDALSIARAAAGRLLERIRERPGARG